MVGWNGKRRSRGSKKRRRRATYQGRRRRKGLPASAKRGRRAMGAREYITQRSSQIDQGKIDALTTIEDMHGIQRVVLGLRQKVQVERLREPDTALANAMEQNATELEALEKAFDAVVNTVEGLPGAFAKVDAAEKRLESALPSTEPPSSGGPPST